MSASDLRRRLAKLEASKKRKRVIDHEGMSTFELARRVAFTLTCAVHGHGGEETLNAATNICRILFESRARPDADRVKQAGEAKQSA